MIKKILQTATNPGFIIIRLMVGVVFLSEGIQKFLFPAIRGAGRFEKIGLPCRGFLGSFVGILEVVCGTLVLIGLLTRLASIPLLFIMVVALSVIKFKIWPMMGSGK